MEVLTASGPSPPLLQAGTVKDLRHCDIKVRLQKQPALRKAMRQEAYMACVLFSIAYELSLSGYQKEASSAGDTAKSSVSGDEFEVRWPRWVHILELFIYWTLSEKFIHLYLNYISSSVSEICSSYLRKVS